MNEIQQTGALSFAVQQQLLQEDPASERLFSALQRKVTSLEDAKEAATRQGQQALAEAQAASKL